MKSTPLTIPPPLQPFVAKAFSIQRNAPGGHFHFGLVPRIFPAFIFNFSDSGDIFNKMQEQRNLKQNCIYYGGVGCTPVEIGIPPMASFIVVLLHPHCTGLFFQEDALHFAENRYLVSDTSPSMDLLNHQLAVEKDMTKKWELIQQFLLATVRHRLPNRYVLNAIQQIFATQGLCSVKTIAQNSFTSPRNLGTLFRQHVGISPKKFAASVRFISFMDHWVNETRTGNLLSLAFDLDYYDLSHLNKDFKKFTSLSPEAYLKQEHVINRLIIA